MKRRQVYKGDLNNLWTLFHMAGIQATMKNKDGYKQFIVTEPEGTINWFDGSARKTISIQGDHVFRECMNERLAPLLEGGSSAIANRLNPLAPFVEHLERLGLRVRRSEDNVADLEDGDNGCNMRLENCGEGRIWLSASFERPVFRRSGEEIAESLDRLHEFLEVAQVRGIDDGDSIEAAAPVDLEQYDARKFGRFFRQWNRDLSRVKRWCRSVPQDLDYGSVFALRVDAEQDQDLLDYLSGVQADGRELGCFIGHGRLYFMTAPKGVCVPRHIEDLDHEPYPCLVMSGGLIPSLPSNGAEQ